MTTLKQVSRTFQLEREFPSTGIDFGDTERYIPWRPSCPIKFNGFVIKTVQAHMNRALPLCVLGWNNSNSKDGAYYPIGKFSCVMCNREHYMNPLQQKYAYVYESADNSSSEDTRGLLCDTCGKKLPTHLIFDTFDETCPKEHVHAGTLHTLSLEKKS